MSRKKSKRKRQKLSSGNKRLTKRNIPQNKLSIDTDSEFAKALKYHQSGQLYRAEEIYKRILETNPNHSDSLHLLGVIAHQVSKNDIAVDLIKKAIQRNPGNPIYYNNLGIALKDLGKLIEAIPCFKRALEIKPDYVEAYYNLGNALKDQDKLTEAISSYQKALEIKPDFAEAHNNMGTVLKDLGKLTEAISCFQKALGIKPDYAEVYNNMGSALKDQGKSVEAITCYQKALEIKPDYAESYSELFHQLQLTCTWQKLEGMTAKLDDFTTKALDNEKKTAETPFVSLARHADLSRNFAIAKSWSYDIAKGMSTLKIHFSFDGRSLKTKINVGYLSNDFRNHPMAHLILSLFGLHNRDKFNIFCYSYGEDDGSYYRERIQRDCDKFIDLSNLGHADAAKCIYEDQIDILVDLKGYTRGSRVEICALRPAPIQVRYLGLAGTTGADFFDYIITDRIVTPEDHAQFYTENFVYMPQCYQVNDHTQDVSNKDWKKADFGLREDSFVFCSFNQGYKIEPVMFNTWMKILRQVPEGVLWLQRGSENTEKNLEREAERRGVKSTRLFFSEKLSKDRHLGRLRLVDLALDTRIVNGAITTSDALWAGVPVITLQGGAFASCMSSSILNAIGLPELITQTLEEYEALAIGLARNPGELEMIRQKITRNRSVEPLFDTPGFTRNLEKAYKEMWEIFVAGERPRQIKVVESKI